MKNRRVIKTKIPRGNRKPNPGDDNIENKHGGGTPITQKNKKSTQKDYHGPIKTDNAKARFNKICTNLK